MISDARGGHVSPGVYTEEKDVLYAAKSLGITSLGLVGETLKGPAFQAMPVTDWADFVDYFGGTSPEKYKGNGLPKYELPYVAKEYLKESKNLNVVRVLGLSGYECGPAFGVYATIAPPPTPKKEADSKFEGTIPVVVLRSKADYNDTVDGGECEKARQEKFHPFVKSVKIGPYMGAEYDAVCAVVGEDVTIATKGIIVCDENGNNKMAISLDPENDDKYKGTRSATYQVDRAVRTEYKIEIQGVGNEEVGDYIRIDDIHKVNDQGESVQPSSSDEDALFYIENHYYDDEKEIPITRKVYVKKGDFLVVKSKHETPRGGNTRDINPVDPIEWGPYMPKEMGKFSLGVTLEGNSSYDDDDELIVYNVSLNPLDRDYIYNVFSIDPLVGSAPLYIEAVYDYAYKEAIKNAPCESTIEFSSFGENGEGVKVSKEVDENGNPLEDYTNYKEFYRCAQTPWIVSEVKEATTSAINLKKLFKFYTISDGNAANYQIKISIQRIRPDEGLFDVWIRDFYDTDESPVVLEKFSNCSMVEGANNYIGYKIGTFDGGYVAKSKYVTVEIAQEDGVESCVPCGFLGYPMPTYNADRINIAYNTQFLDSVKPKRQYFGLNNRILDVDILNYKGVTAYANGVGDANPDKITNGFHLDAILSMPGDEEISGNSLVNSIIFVDNESGYTFTTVDGMQDAAQSVKLPRLFNEAYTEDTIYEDINLRKFTVYPYGGFDGWDIYRPERTNTDKYKASKYAIVDGCPFTSITATELELDPTLNLGLKKNAINSDYYAFLAGYNQFANPQDVYINLFATPGVDYFHHTLLVEDALDLIEDQEDGRGGDALYVINAPMDVNEDKSPDVIAEALEDSELVSSYACTYWPWVKYYDAENRMYLTLPVTKDVVRNMAATDNNSYPWFAPAGTERGNIDCIKADIKTTLSDEDTLYESRVNPIKTFAQDGVKVWGNKTLYDKDSPLNRINVRRLMLRIKKLIVEASKHLIFEQYDATLEKQFRSLVEPILSDAKSNRGIVDYRVVTESTPETRDQHILPARILVKPTPALEYISISFVVYPESIAFDE